MSAAWLFWIALGHADCPDVASLLEQLEESVLVVDLEQAEAHLESFEAAHGCAWVGPTELARFWTAEGAYWHYRKNDSRATSAFEAARRVAPDRFEVPYGSKLSALWDGTPSAEGAGTLLVEPVPADIVLRVDGRRSEPRTEVAPGVHSVQVGPASGPEFAELRLVVAGTVNGVSTGLKGRTPPAEPPERPDEPAKKRKLGWLLPASVICIGAGGGLLAANRVAYGRYDSLEPGPDAAARIDRTYRTQVATGVGAYTFLSIGAVGLTATVAL